MKRMKIFLYLLKKIEFGSYLESNDDEKFDCIGRMKIDDFEVFNSV